MACPREDGLALVAAKDAVEEAGEPGLEVVAAQRVVAPRAVDLRLHDAGLAEHLEVVAARRLAHRAAGSRCSRSRRRPRRGCGRAAAGPGHRAPASTSTSSMSSRAGYSSSPPRRGITPPRPRARASASHGVELAVRRPQEPGHQARQPRMRTTIRDPQRRVEARSTNDVARACRRWRRRARRPRPPPCCSASASECVAFAGSPRRVAGSTSGSATPRRLPNTATPSAPPSSRVVSLTAEPTPALFSGSDR